MEWWRSALARRSARSQPCTFPDTLSLTTQGLSLWCFRHSGGRDFDLFPDTTHYSQGLSLWGVST